MPPQLSAAEASPFPRPRSSASGTRSAALISSLDLGKEPFLQLWIFCFILTVASCVVKRFQQSQYIKIYCLKSPTNHQKSSQTLDRWKPLQKPGGSCDLWWASVTSEGGVRHPSCYDSLTLIQFVHIGCEYTRRHVQIVHRFQISNIDISVILMSKSERTMYMT